MKWKKTLSAAAFILGTAGFAAAWQQCLFFLAQQNDPEKPEQFYLWHQNRIHYKKSGQGPPILLLHSLCPGASHREFSAIIQQLSKHFTVYRPDLLGYGFSDCPKITYTSYTDACMIQDFIANVIQAPCFALGVNGSATALTVAAALDPTKFRRLFLLSPTGITDPVAQNRDRLIQRILELPFYGTMKYLSAVSRRKIAYFLKKDGFYAPEKVTKELVDQFYFPSHSANTAARFSYASQKAHFRTMTFLPFFQKLTVPYAIGWGEENKENPIENMAMLEKLHPEKPYYIFEKTRLFPHLENPAAFSQLL